MPLLTRLDQSPQALHDAETIARYFREAIQLLGCDGWRVAVQETSNHMISVRNSTKLVIVPMTRKVTSINLQKLLIHEILTHVLRSTHGFMTPLRLLGNGLSGVLPAEEGLATAHEQVWSGQMTELSGESAYLAIGLACGIDGTPRDFRQVYEIMLPYFTWKTIVQQPTLTTTQLTDRARLLTWRRCVRTFRGTPCHVPGLAFTKDLNYREGNYAIWQVATTLPQEIRRFHCGKYNPADPAHRAIVDQLGL